MDYTVDMFTKDLQDCLVLAKKELNDRKKGIDGESTIDQIENYIIPDLTNILSNIDNDKPLPPNSQRDRYINSFGYAFKVWGWDMIHPTELYLRLLRLDENYRKLK